MLMSLSKEQLVQLLTKSRTASTSAEADLHKVKKQMKVIKAKLDAHRKQVAFSEKKREEHEVKEKNEEKQAALKRKMSKMKKKEKLSDILMDHGVKYHAFKAAKKYRKKGEDIQKKQVLKMAKRGGRAGSVAPLRKVARTLAVQAVKAKRAEMKKSKKHVSRHKIRKMCDNAAKTAVNKILSEQDALITKSVAKWTKAAIAKYPPRLLRAAPSDKPNKFTAPPSIHLSLGGSDEKEVTQLKEHAKAHKKAEKKIAAKVAAPKKAAKKAAKKADVHEIVPEHKL